MENKHLIHPRIKEQYLRDRIFLLFTLDMYELNNNQRRNHVGYINVDRQLAQRDIERGIYTVKESKCVFIQIFNELYSHGEDIWCVNHDEEFVYKVSFVGEMAIDAGGPYRESLHQMVEDLFSEHFDLFIPSNNNTYKHGMDSDCYVPNPLYTDLSYLNMYEFVGRIMGYSIRAHCIFLIII